MAGNMSAINKLQRVNEVRRQNQAIKDLFIALSFCTLMSIVLMLGPGGCRQQNAQIGESQQPQSAQSDEATRQEVSSMSARNLVVFLGDSLTAGYNLFPKQSFPALIAAHWREQGYNWRVQNAGISGDTTAGVLRRLNWVITDDVHTVFLAIGANDGLRGLSLAEMKRNISQTIEILQQRNIRVILAGIKIPTNYGRDYTRNFAEIYPELARQYKLELLPFLLDEVAGHSHLNFADGIHPNAEGYKIIARNILNFFAERKLFPR
jgi:acyl-CoA thioesterase-1